ncbi:MAG: aminotransferase class V-fold PLP-dependent enzyme [Deltaproteobacteria bacterium]|nr:aminotransferase class V-fold PLP-dependent enzyme [Deltaproteobacteria bacterium]
METIYFDNAATSWPKPEAMIKAMADFNAHVGANPGRSGHRLSVEASRIIFNARETIASLLGAGDPHTVIFTRNATEGINTIVRGLLKPGNHVITSGMEHNSVMRPLRALEAEGIELSIVQCSGTGDIVTDDVIAMIRKNTRMIIITHASNVTGTIMPVAEIAEMAHAKGVLVCVDAAQSAGSLPINVLKDNIDILVFTGHKSLNGPQGTGGFFIRKGLENLVSPLERGGTGSRSEFEEHPDFMPDRFESGTPNTIGIAGLGAGAAHVAAIGIDTIRKHEISVTGLFLDGISSIKGIKIYGDMNPQRRTALVSFTIEGLSPSEISFELDERFNIMSRPGLHCAPSAHRTIGTFSDGTVRFSFGIFTTEEEIMTAINAIETLSLEHN